MIDINDLFDSTIKMDEEFRAEIKKVELLNERLYDVTIEPVYFRNYMARLVFSDLEAAGFSEDLSHLFSILNGTLFDESFASRLIALRFSNTRSFPWTIDDLSSMHRALMVGCAGCSPGRLRVGPMDGVPEEFQYYVEMGLVRLVDIINRAPYPPVVSASILWNVMMLSKPFGDCPLFYAEVLSRYLYSRNYRGISRCGLVHKLMECADELSRSRVTFMEKADPNPMLRCTVSCILDAYESAYQVLRPVDVKGVVDGISRSIIRHSRQRVDFGISDARQWLGDLSDQTLRTRVQSLVDMGILARIGNTKATKYRYIDPFDRVRSRCGGQHPYMDEDELQSFYIGNVNVIRP